MYTSCQILTLKHGKCLNEFGNQGSVPRVYFSSVSVLRPIVHSAAEREIFWCLCGLAANVRFWLTAPFSCIFLLHFPPFPFPFVLSSSLTMSHEFMNTRFQQVDLCLKEPWEPEVKLKKQHMHILCFLWPRRVKDDIFRAGCGFCRPSMPHHSAVSTFLDIWVKWRWKTPIFPKKFYV